MTRELRWPIALLAYFHGGFLLFAIDDMWLRLLPLWAIIAWAALLCAIIVVMVFHTFGFLRGRAGLAAAALFAVIALRLDKTVGPSWLWIAVAIIALLVGWTSLKDHWLRR